MIAYPEPVDDTFGDRLEIKIVDMILELADLHDIRVVYRGEPGVVPVKLYPFVIVFMRREREAQGEEGYGEDTGFQAWNHSGYVSIEVLFKDTATLMPVNRRATVGSYLQSKEFTQAVKQKLTAWDLNADPVVSYGGYQKTVGQLYVDDIVNAMESRDATNVSNRGNISFHLFSRKPKF